MALNFTTKQLTLNRQLVTASGSGLYVNGLLFGSGLYVTIGVAESSGSYLYSTLTGLSGQSTTDYATKTQLVITGQTLDNKINVLSGFVVATTGQTNGGYPSGLFTETESLPVVRVTTGQKFEVLGAGASGSSPPSTNLNMLVVQPIRGATGWLLGEPDGWWSILVSGRSARVPYYYT